MSENRFTDQNKRLSDFQVEVWVHCPQCQNQAFARRFAETKSARLTCSNCGYHKEETTQMPYTNGTTYEFIQAAHGYFGAKLWFSAPFKNQTFWAYNLEHLKYLEAYIGAKLREHTDRTHFTLLEKLPKFYHEAKNRDPLLKLIEKLKRKTS